jgi:hypothetical protein
VRNQKSRHVKIIIRVEYEYGHIDSEIDSRKLCSVVVLVFPRDQQHRQA